jgi:hypothetical protein
MKASEGEGGLPMATEHRRGDFIFYISNVYNGYVSEMKTPVEGE